MFSSLSSPIWNRSCVFVSASCSTFGGENEPTTLKSCCHTASTWWTLTITLRTSGPHREGQGLFSKLLPLVPFKQISTVLVRRGSTVCKLFPKLPPSPGGPIMRQNLNVFEKAQGFPSMVGRELHFRVAEPRSLLPSQWAKCQTPLAFNRGVNFTAQCSGVSTYKYVTRNIVCMCVWR